MGKLNWQFGLIAAATLTVAGSLAWFNPDQQAFESYARQQLSSYLQDNLCEDIVSPLGKFIDLPCEELVIENQDLLNGLIQDRTQRDNYLLFSIYRTSLMLPFGGILPGYEVTTLGIGGRFYIIHISQQ